MKSQSFLTSRSAMLRLASLVTAFACVFPAPSAHALTGVNGSPVVVQFPATAVGNTSAGILETVTIVGYAGPFPPTFTQHYAKDYYFGGQTCSGSNPVTCTLTVYFRPTLPGVRKEAVFVFNNGTRIGSILFSGVGTAPLAALQPGVVTSPAGLQISMAGYAKTIVTDENGVVYFYNSGANTIQSCATGCASPTTLVSNVGSIFDLAIDGAGVLYWGEGGNTAASVTTLNTYDTVQGIQSTVTLPASDVYYNTTVDGMGDIFAIGNSSGNIYKVLPNGTSTTTPVNPAVGQDYYSNTDSLGNLFLGGGTINELTTGGTQTQVSTSGTGTFGIDAADTLYSSNTNGVIELAPGNYNATSYTFSAFANTPITGITSQSSGTLYLGTLGGIYEINRAQDTIAFGSQNEGTTSATQTVNMLNIGNMPLALSNIALTGAGYTLQTAPTNPCTAGIMLAAGASCNLAVNFESPNAGNYPGSIVVTSNSLNNTNSTETITLTAFINGAYLTVSPASLPFNPQTIATSTSKTLTITNSGFGGSATLSGLASSNSAFTVVAASSNGCGATLAVNASCALTVTFTPTLPQSYSGNISLTGNEGGGTPASSISVPTTGTGLPVITQTAGGSGSVITFNNAAVGVSQASAQTITASFLITGETTLVSPTASMHYGLSYTLGTLACTGSIGAQTCTVPVTFIPNLPGGRRDALFLTVNGTRIVTALVYGIGTAPFALIQPGVVTQPILNSGGYYYTGIVDENGTAYILGDNTNTVYSITKTGVVTLLPITGLNSPRDIGIDGAGVLYIADQTAHGVITTYDTVQGTQSSVPFASAEFYNQGVAVGNTGNIYLTDGINIYAEPIVGSGTAKTTAISPAITQGSLMTVDSSENVFIGGYQTNELTPSGTQTQINTSGGNSGIGVDAADTIYSGRYGSGGIGMLPASNYAAAEAYVDGSAPVLGLAVGSDGTVYAGDYSSVDKVDRSQGQFTFNAFNLTQTATPQVATIYNGGNMPLTITSLTLTGDPDYTLTANTCGSGTVIAVGAICTVAVNFTAPGHGGVFNANIALVTNSLNTTTSANIALTDTVAYPYVTVSPTSLTFANQADGTTSAAQTVTYTNSGAAIADLYSANMAIGGTITTQYAITLAAGCTSIAIGGTCTGSVVFKPTAAATVNATGNAYQSNFGTPSPVTFTVTGTGVAPAPAATFNPNPVAFANQAAGTTSAATTVQLTNSGTASLTLTGITLTGTNPSNFILLTAATTPCTSTVTLAIGASCNISVAFNPNAAAAFSASISVADNATPSPQFVPLTGTGTFTPTPQLQFTPGQLSFFAGTGTASLNGTGNGGPALSATFDAPYATAQDASGNTYIVDQGANTVRKVDINGNITTFAGVPGYGPGSFGGDGNLAVNANLSNPTGVAVDSYGNVYIADYGNLRIRKVVPATGIITTYIGNGSGYTNFSPGPNTPIPGVSGLCFDPAGNLYLATGYAELVLKVTPALAVSVYAGDFTGLPNGTAGYNGDNIPANTAKLNNPNSVASDQLGNIYIADSGNYRVRMVAAGTGIITTFAGNGTAPGTTNAGDGGPATSTPVSPGGVATDLAGDLYITSGLGTGLNSPNVVREVKTNGNIYTVAGGGAGTTISGPATAVSLPAVGLPSMANNGSILLSAFAYTIMQDGVIAVGPAGYLQFGSQNVNTTSAPQTITFTNTGAAVLSLNSSTYTATGNFAVTGGTCQGLSTLASGATCTLTVTFTPTSAGTLNGSISVPSNSPVGTQSILLQGTGVTAAAAQASLTPGSNAFANTAVGTSSSTFTFNLANPGTATLNITSIALGGTNASSFSITSNACGTTLAAGANCNIMVAFSPQAAGALTATLVATDSATPTTQSATLSGTGTAPQAALAPALTFASTTVGNTTAAQTVTLSNAGNAALPITSAATSNTQFVISANTCGSSLAAGTSCTYSITFTPSATGPQTANLNVVDSVGTQTVSLTGTGTPAPTPQAVLTSGLSFSPTPVGASAPTQTLTLSNTGAASLTITSIVAAGAGFSQTNNCGTSVAASASCSIVVTFTPGSAGALTGTVTVTDNSTPSTQTATLSGAGTAPQAALSATVAFPSTVVGATTAAMTATLTNAGNAALPITSATVSNPQFVISANTCGSSLAAGASCTYSITFTPTATGAQTATLSVADSVGTQTAALSGTGTAAQAALSPTTFTFASTFMGTPSAAQVFTLSNPGTATLTGIAISLTGANTSAYSETTTCATTLAAAATCSISVIFTPAAAATYTANLSVADSVGTQTATLSGSGNSSTGFMVVAPNPTQAVDPGGIAVFNINVNTLTGNFTLPVTLSASGLPPGATYTFNPASVIPGTTGAPSVLTIQTSPQFALRSPASNPALRMPIFAVLVFLPLAGLRRIRRKLRALSPGLRLLTLILLSLAAFLPLSGCGGGGYFGQGPQAFVITITGTSTAATQSTTVTLNLQ